MKTIFVLANILSGALALFFGLIALTDSEHHVVASVVVGILALGLGSTCVWIARQSVSTLQKKTPQDPDFA